MVASLTNQIFLSKVTEGGIARWLSNFPTKVLFHSLPFRFLLVVSLSHKQQQQLQLLKTVTTKVVPMLPGGAGGGNSVFFQVTIFHYGIL